MELGTGKTSVKIPMVTNSTIQRQKIDVSNSSTIEEASHQRANQSQDAYETNGYKDVSKASIKRILSDQRQFEHSRNRTVSDFKQKKQGEVELLQMEAQEEIREMKEAHQKRMKKIRHESLNLKEEDDSAIPNVEKELERPRQDTNTRTEMDARALELKNTKAGITMNAKMKQMLQNGMSEPTVQIHRIIQPHCTAVSFQKQNQTDILHSEMEANHKKRLKEIKRDAQRKKEQERRLQEEARKRRNIFMRFKRMITSWFYS